MKNELIRKSLHIAAAVCVAFVAPLMSLFLFVILCTIIIFSLPYIRWHKLVRRYILVPRGTHGDIYFFVGVLLTALFFLPYEKEAFEFGILVLGFSDGLAAVVGQLSRSRGYRILGRKKTFIGSLTFFVSTLLVGSLYAQTIAPLLFVCLLLTITENVVLSGFDNIVIPLFAAFLFGFF